VVVSVIIIAAFFSFGFLTARKQAEALERIIRTESEAVTRNIAESCANYLAVWDFAGLEELLVRYTELPDILRLQATEPDGTVLSDVDTSSGYSTVQRPGRIPAPSLPAVRTEMENNQLIVWHPISAGSHLGWIKATISLHELTETTAAVWRNTVLLAAVWMVVSTGLILFVMRRPVAAIQRLSRFAGNLNAGKGQQMTVPESSSEVEELGASLNRASRELKESELRLIAEREKLAVTLHSIGDGVIATDTAGTIALLNRTAEELTGWSASEAVNRPLSEVFRIIHEETREPIEDPIRTVMATKQIVGVSNHASLIARGGAERNIADSGAPIIDGEGNIIGVVLAFRDVTEKKRSEQFIRSIFESIGEGLIVIDSTYRILSANRAFAEQAGKPLQETIGRFCYQISHNRSTPCCKAEDSDPCPARRTFATGKPAAAVHIHGKDIRRLTFVEVRTFPLKDAAGSVVSVIETVTDITERKKLEEQLRQAQKMEAVGQLAGGVAHDFNNILTAITGYGNLLLLKLKGKEDLRHYTEEILSSTERAAKLTGSLLAFSRKQVIEVKPADLKEIVNGIHKLLLRLIGEDIELSINSGGKNGLILADRGQIEQVLMNLVTNARDAMPSGGSVMLETGDMEIDEASCREHGFEKPGLYRVLSVSDTGIGMDETTRVRIFDPFFTTKEVGKGTGLGLAIVYGIMKQHGGAITVHSEPGKGSTFKLYFPLITPSAEVAYENKTPQPATGGTETILLAEDDIAVRQLIKLVLEGAGYRVIESADGEEAILRFQERADTVKLVITDVVMPRKNGKEVYDAIQSLRPGMKALFMSGYTADIIKSRGIVERGMHYLSKPVAPETLLRKVRAILDE
jgi:PAS domain S-box-containing protein